jgi:hypothetical protein
MVQTHIYKKYLSFHNVATLVIYWSNIKVFQKAKCWKVEDKTTSILSCVLIKFCLVSISFPRKVFKLSLKICNVINWKKCFR